MIRRVWCVPLWRAYSQGIQICIRREKLNVRTRKSQARTDTHAHIERLLIV